MSAPQAGSTADVGNGSEGLYESLWGYTLIDSNGKLARKGLLDWTWGSITVSGLNWSFDAGTKSLDTFGAKDVSGSGTFSPKVSMDGSYTRGTSTSTSSSAWGPLTYNRENALAVNQASVVGKWVAGDQSMAIEVGADGKLTGTTSGSKVGVCNVSGTLLHAAPQTSKNMYAIRFDATNAATGTEKACDLDTTSAYQGLAAIVLSPAGDYVANGYFRSLTLHALSAQAVLSVSLPKQR